MQKFIFHYFFASCCLSLSPKSETKHNCVTPLESRKRQMDQLELRITTPRSLPFQRLREDSKRGKPSSAKRIGFILCCLVATLIIAVSLLAQVTKDEKVAKTQHDSDKQPRKVVHCKIIVVGGGFAGVYAFYKLAPLYGSDLCLVESENRLGGRVYDVSATPGGPVFGVGAIRVTSAQQTMIALAHELNMILQQQESDIELMKVRGRYYYRDVSQPKSRNTTVMCREAFAGLNCDIGGETTPPDTAMLQKLVQAYEQNKSIASQFVDFPNYIMSIFGDEGLAFIRESVRYNSPFKSVSTQGILDFFNIEFRDMVLDPDRYYPEGGMSQYIIRMAAAAQQHGSVIYMSEPVISINEVTIRSHRKHVKGFELLTPHYAFTAERVLCAIDPLHLRAVTGDIAQQIITAPEFNVILPNTLAIVTAWWPERWWEKSEVARNARLSRIVSHENCFNTMDIPTFPYGRDQNVTRAVYDDGACVSTWETLEAAGPEGLEMLSKTVTESLGRVVTDVEIPTPSSLHIHVHRNAWHFQIANSSITNQQIFDWSQRPLPGKNFVLIGEGYNLNFAAWCDGALKSAMWALANFYDFEFPCLNDVGSPANCKKFDKQETRK
eukprot:c12362_g1_i2.p1 GENE.c12362_g1_i2~~c12362_g1_i2.p1  ORF type:complete len:608 (+),score=98.41 c12362_g1_i2:122-1945(+)